MLNVKCSPLTARLWMENTSFAWPDVDIAESDNHFIFSFEIPGALKDDVKVWLDGDVLTVSGEKKVNLKDGDTRLISEREYGKFERSFRLSRPVDRNKITAEFVDGVLVVTLPKTVEARAKEISIN